jgi:hypothetical protein
MELGDFLLDGYMEVWLSAWSMPCFGGGMLGILGRALSPRWHGHTWLLA